MNSNVASIAKRYSNALFESLRSNDEIKQVRSQTELLIELLSPEVETFFSKAVIDKRFKKEVLDDLIKQLSLNELLAKTLKLLGENSRLGALKPFLSDLLASLDDILEIKRVEYICAAAMSDTEVKSLEKELVAALKKSVQLTITVQPEILAGCIIKIGHQVVDMSLTTRITNIREALSQGV